MNYRKQIKESNKLYPDVWILQQENFKLISEKDFRMNTVYEFEKRGIDLVTALQITDDIVFLIKKEGLI